MNQWIKYCCCFYRKTNLEDALISWENTKPFIPPVTRGLVIKVYDGDTITIATYLPYNNKDCYRFSVRLAGIDCPEIKSNNIEEKTMAKEARDYLCQQILGKKVELKNVSSDKYGRLLADIFLDNIHINHVMKEHRFAVEYDGGTKKVPSSWLKYKLTSEMD